MENMPKPKINLKQHIPQKASKKFILHIILYVVAFAGVGLLFYYRFNKIKPVKKEKINTESIEIHRVKIE